MGNWGLPVGNWGLPMGNWGLPLGNWGLPTGMCEAVSKCVIYKMFPSKLKRISEHSRLKVSVGIAPEYILSPLPSRAALAALLRPLEARLEPKRRAGYVLRIL